MRNELEDYLRTMARVRATGDRRMFIIEHGQAPDPDDPDQDEARESPLAKGNVRSFDVDDLYKLCRNYGVKDDNIYHYEDAYEDEYYNVYMFGQPGVVDTMP